MDIRPNRDAGSADKLLLNGEYQELVSVQVDGVLLEPSRYQLEDGMLVISGLSEGHRVTVTSTHNPYENAALEGLYASGGMLCTQCEPEGFRRICFYPDRPDVMSIFSVRIEADVAWPNLLSNGNLVEKGTAGKGRHLPSGMIRTKNRPIYLRWLPGIWNVWQIALLPPLAVMWICTSMWKRAMRT